MLGLFDQREAVGDHVEVAQPEEVHLEQAEVLHPVHLVLGDDGRLLDGLAGLGLALDRQVLGEGLVGDHDRGGVDAVLATESLEPLCDLDHPGDVGIGADHVAQFPGRLVAVDVLGVLLEAVLERRVAAHDERRHRLRDLVADRVGVAEHPGRVAHRRPCLDLAEGDDLGDVVASVLLRRVADHVVAVAGVEVHVDVGHRHPRRVQEAFEQEVVLDRVEIRDPQRVGHRAAGGRATAGPDPDVVVAGELDQVPGDQEVGREPHAVDDTELVVEPFGDVLGQGLAPAPPRPVVGEVAQVVGVGGEPRREGELGQPWLAELDGDVGPLGDPQRVVAGRRHLGEEPPHLPRALQVVLVAVELEAIGVAQQRPGLHAQQGVVGLGVVLVGVVRVVRGQQRGADLPCDLEQLRIGRTLLGDAVVLDLDEEVVTPEDLLEAGRLFERDLLLALQEALQDVAAEATGGDDQALVVPVEQLPVGPGLVVVAGEEGLARELDQVPVADVALGQEDRVVVELLSATGVAAGVVGLAPPVRTLGPRLVGQVDLGADDRLDALFPTAPVEVEDAVHVAVIGDAEGRLTVDDRGVDHIIEARRAVEHRVLGVDVEMCGQLPHGLP